MSCEYCSGGKPFVEADEEIGLLDVKIDGGKLVIRFWSSDILTGNQTAITSSISSLLFWSSDILTGNQTLVNCHSSVAGFWSSDILTGNQTKHCQFQRRMRFGAVTF